MKRPKTALCSIVVSALALTGPTSTVPAAAAGPNLPEVWSLEDDYWRFVKAGDVQSYRTLWHESFIGWPCHEDRPVGKSAIGNWVQEIRDKKVSFTSELTREGAQEFGNIVVVHYRVTMVSTYPDGRVEGRGQISKITHTWMRVGNTWQIIGGMCGRLTQPER
jgi:ketosteroid isomerase-like protein